MFGIWDGVIGIGAVYLVFGMVLLVFGTLYLAFWTVYLIFGWCVYFVSGVVR